MQKQFHLFFKKLLAFISVFILCSAFFPKIKAVTFPTQIIQGMQEIHTMSFSLAKEYTENLIHRNPDISYESYNKSLIDWRRSIVEIYNEILRSPYGEIKATYFIYFVWHYKLYPLDFISLYSDSVPYLINSSVEMLVTEEFQGGCIKFKATLIQPTTKSSTKIKIYV